MTELIEEITNLTKDIWALGKAYKLEQDSDSLASIARMMGHKFVYLGGLWHQIADATEKGLERII